MMPRLSTVAVVVLMASCGGSQDSWRSHPTSIMGPPAEAAPADGATPTCTAEDLVPPADCPGTQDLSYSAVCAVDCFGNVFPMNHNGWLVLPGDRFYAVAFLAGGERPAGPPFVVRAYTGPSESPETNPELEPLSRSSDRATVPVDVDMRRDGSVFVRMNRKFGTAGGEQFRIEMQFTPVTGYAFGAFVSGPQP
jgi:hypothetical protein